MTDFQRDAWCVLGLPFDAVDMPDTVCRVRDAASRRVRCDLATPNLNFMVAAQRNASFRDVVVGCDLVIADGMPVVWIGRALGTPIRRKVSGSDLVEVLMSEKERSPLGVYFFGGDEGVAADACRRIGTRPSGLKCVGHEYPGFGSIAEMSGDDTIARINASGADFLVVALGAAKGHAWMERNRTRLTVPVVSHLGAVVNFLAAKVRRAPLAMQRLGLEWAWRILEEPQLWRRYLGDGLVIARLLATRVLPHMIYLARSAPTTTELAAAKVVCEEHPGRTVLKVRGAWKRDNLTPLRQCFARAAQGGADLVLDMTAVAYIDAAVVALVQLLEGHQRRNGRRLEIVAGATVRRVFKYCCADYLLALAPAWPRANEMRSRTEGADERRLDSCS